ncbi:MAG: DUF1877 family protein [Alphaproteobacteria bacterium]|nr:DUF1877 family protein [Alphaproteobacteria bacterium]
MAQLDSLDSETCQAFLIGLEPFLPKDPTLILDFIDSWHIVHFLSSGTEWDRDLPGGFILGGDYWLQWDKDTEPMTILSSEVVKAVSAHLRNLNDETIDARLQEMAKGNTEIYHAEITESEFPALKAILSQIRNFVDMAAQNDQAIVKEIG